MLTLDALAARRATIEESDDLVALRSRLVERARPVLERFPPVPGVKALLSRDGGNCPEDGAQLEFDPWNPDSHQCPNCGRSFSGERHHAHWARAQHLWIAERAAHLATVCAVTGDAPAGERARELLAAYYTLYFELPNSDNVLGPSHLFFSTYLESIWILDYLAAAFLLRELEILTPEDIESIDAIANEAATIIAEFNEGMSNRQTWNSAALTAIAAWFGDEELAVSAIEGRTGLLGHLADGFGVDGMWFEGENYHLFALRGLLIGLQWARTTDQDLLSDEAIAAHFADALMAPTRSALPDLTFPARKDARYGVSLAHPAYVECWEIGRAGLDHRAPAALTSWLRALYQVKPRREATYDAYLHEAGEPLPAQRTRADLSWLALLTMPATLPDDGAEWVGGSALLEQQGLAIIRHDSTYIGLECGGGGEGHGHPDRLHLTLFANGVPWLPDPGAGSYTTRDLYWYRSTLAHNAPMLDGQNQSSDQPARCVAFDAGAEWAWVVATWQGVRRTIVSSPRWALDIVQLDADSRRQLDVPWHFNAALQVETAGDWEPATLNSEFVDQVEQLTGGLANGFVIAATSGSEALRVWFAGDGELLRATALDLPGRTGRRQFMDRRITSNSGRMVTVLDMSGGVTAVSVRGDVVEIAEGDLSTTVQLRGGEAAISSGTSRISLAGGRPAPIPSASFVRDRPIVTTGEAIWIDAPPALDGSLQGFDRSAPLAIDEEHHYFRSEDAYAGPDVFSAMAYVNWSDDDLFVAIDVTKDGMVMRPPDAAPLNLDNEPDDINADSVQVYWRDLDGTVHGWLIAPAANGTCASRSLAALASGPVVGKWMKTDAGYRVTVRIPCPGLIDRGRTDRLGFDLIVNEMREGRVRRAGQLVWSGGPGWVYLRGDRQAPADFGELELVG